MGEKKLSDFIRKNIPDWDYDEDATKYPPVKVAPEWFTDAASLTKNWWNYLCDKHPYTGFSYVNLNDFYWGMPPKFFKLTYEIQYNLGPSGPDAIQDIKRVNTYGLKEIQEASYDDLMSIFIHNDNASSYHDEEWFDKYVRHSWKEFKEIAEAFDDCFDELVDAQEATYEEACYMLSKAKTSPEEMAKFILFRNPLPPFFNPNYRIKFDKTSQALQVNFTFPDYKNEDIPAGIKGKVASEVAKRKIVKETLYSLIIWVGHVLAIHLKDFNIKQIAINVDQSWFDPATGMKISGIIASVLGASDHFSSLNIREVDPIACMRQLKGITTPSLENQSPIRPIFDLNMNDKRVVDSKDIDGTLEEGENLAAMPWEDFEHLVGQLFEWEFAKDGAEVKVTQASRDRGVDAILFDQDPVRGGKYVIQAKRYTKTVDAASVRELWGTLMNEGANRGILITTSSYGPDSYEFAKDKPISLVDGPNLIKMLSKHGKNYKIDLKEARDILGLNAL